MRLFEELALDVAGPDLALRDGRHPWKPAAMRTLVRSFAVVCASFVMPSHAVEPVAVSQDVVVEEAWARVDAIGATEIFLVVNNRSAVGAVLGIQIPAATEVQVINAAGRPIELSIPIHSELYMDPEGVRIMATGLPVVRYRAVPRIAGS